MLDYSEDYSVYLLLVHNIQIFITKNEIHATRQSTTITHPKNIIPEKRKSPLALSQLNSHLPFKRQTSGVCPSVKKRKYPSRQGRERDSINFGSLLI